MIKLISTYTGPSIETLAKIHLVNRLNASGLQACLYGNERWPETFCDFKPLVEFDTTSKDIIINDGFKVDSLFELVNLEFHRYSAGRKRRLLQISRCILKYVRAVSTFSIPQKCILFKHSSPSATSAYYALDARKAAWDLVSAINSDPSLTKIDAEKTTLSYDINRDNNLRDKILSASTRHVVLAGAITEPNYFRESVLPFLDNDKHVITYIGLQDKTVDDLFTRLNHLCREPIQKWLKILK